MELANLSDELADIELAQGAGGNISVKAGNTMVVKASGFTFKNMKHGGIVNVNHEAIAAIYSEGDLSEDDARKIIYNSVVDSALKPSIEVGFHSFMKKYVIHLHPIFLNGVLASKDAEKVLSSLYEDLRYVFVKYVRPGHNLAAEIYSKRARATVEIYFLQNHGIVVSADDLGICLGTIKSIVQRAKKFVLSKGFTLPAHISPSPTSNKGKAGFIGVYLGKESDYLFPDAVVYLYDLYKQKHGYSLIQGRAFFPLSLDWATDIDEILYAHNAMVAIADKFGGPNPLSKTNMKELIDMEEEKHRKKMVK